MGCEYLGGLEKEVDCLSRDLIPLIVLQTLGNNSSHVHSLYHFDNAPKIDSEDLKKVMRYPVDISDFLSYHRSILADVPPNNDIDEMLLQGSTGKFYSAVQAYLERKGMERNNATRFVDVLVYGPLYDILIDKFPNIPKVLIDTLFVLHDCKDSNVTHNLKICDADLYVYGTPICDSCLQKHSSEIYFPK